MRKIIRYLALAFVVILLLVLSVATYYLLIDTRPPARRPDLVYLPDNLATPPKGYPTWNAAMLWIALGRQKLLDPRKDWEMPETVSVKKDVVYGNVDNRKLLLDLYSPKNLNTPVPGLIFIHGGGWEAGNKKDYTYYTIRFAQRGYVAATIGYRFSDEAGFPGCVEDAKCAVRWMRSHADELHVDPEKIVVIGGSAGAHLAMMAAYASDVPELEGNGGYTGVSSAVAAVVELYGPTDATVEGLRDEPVAHKFMRKTYEEAPEIYRMASPLFHLDASDPPTLVIQGTLDRVVPVNQADALVEKLRNLNIPHWYARLDGWPHGLDIAPEVNDYTQQLITAFLESHLSPPATKVTGNL